MAFLPGEVEEPRGMHVRGERAYQGQALVEFAVIGLILALMLFGVMEFGRAYFASIAVTNAARDGARVAMDPARTEADIEAAAVGASGSIELTADDIDVDRSTTIGETTSVTATYNFESDVPLISSIWGGGPLVISHTATSRVGWE